MCARFTFATDPMNFIRFLLEFEVSDAFTPRYNIAPTQPVAVVPNNGIE